MFHTLTRSEDLAANDFESGTGAERTSLSDTEESRPSTPTQKTSENESTSVPVPEIKVASSPEDDSDLQYISIYDFLKEISPEQQETLHRYAFGHHPEIWYKFKRFETLALINLYHHQHDLIQLEKTILQKKGVMTRDERNCLRVVLKDYYDAIDLFKKTSQLKRPSQESRHQTVDILANTLEEPHYASAPDSLALLDLTPQALGVEPDSIRVLIAKTASRLSSAGPTGDISGWRRAVLQGYLAPQITTHGSYRLRGEDVESQTSLPLDTTLRPPCTPVAPADSPTTREILITRTPGATDVDIDPPRGIRGRPFSLGISPAVDRLARFSVALVAGVFLLVPMVVLSYVGRKKYVLAATCLFVVVFAGTMSLATRASNQELLTATATYAAVLVVFVGERGAGG